MRIRTATINDAEAILRIYAPYVQNTAITFEYDVPTLVEFQSRIANTIKKYPYLVAEKEGEILGYAYAGAFHSRAAFAWSAEVTIYLSDKAKGLGIGRKLYEMLEEKLKEMGIVNLYACIAQPVVEDEYLTKNSTEFHAHMGYTTVGEFLKCGYKFQRWYNMVWMEKIIGEHK